MKIWNIHSTIWHPKVNDLEVFKYLKHFMFIIEILRRLKKSFFRIYEVKENKRSSIILFLALHNKG